MKTKIALITFALLATFNSFSQPLNFMKRKYTKGLFTEQKDKLSNLKIHLFKDKRAGVIASSSNIKNKQSSIDNTALFIESKKDFKIQHSIDSIAYKNSAVLEENKSISKNKSFFINHNTQSSDTSSICSVSKNVVFVKKPTPNFNNLSNDKSNTLLSQKINKSSGYSNGGGEILKGIGCAILLALLYAIGFVITHPEAFATVLPSLAATIEIVAAIIAIIIIIIVCVWLLSYLHDMATISG